MNHSRKDAKASGFNPQVDQASGKPNSSSDLGRRGQAQENAQAKQKAGSGQEGIHDEMPFALRLTNDVELPESSEVDAHET
jgi:hypothetical protein